MVTHNCENRVCKLLNPCLNDLLEYQDLFNRLSKVEKWFLDYLRHDIEKSKSLPLDLIGWAREHAVYQLPNLEFVQELSKAIKKISPETILEIGAGRGIISRHVSKIIQKNIILTDDYSWWTDYGKRHKNCKEMKIGNPEVIKMGYKEAIDKLKPDLIIASWIPYQKYWTKDFRENSSVKGYILIGEAKGGCTGVEEDWTTDWNIIDLDDVEKYGICRSDHGFDKGFGNSRTLFSHTRVTYFER